MTHRSVLSIIWQNLCLVHGYHKIACGVTIYSLVRIFLNSTGVPLYLNDAFSVHRLTFFNQSLLVFSFELFYIVISGPFIADYAVWALLIVEGRTVTYSC